MHSTKDIDAIREHAVLSSSAGAPYLLMFSVAWTVAGVLGFVLPAATAP